jgi:hypothetical protein
MPFSPATTIRDPASRTRRRSEVQSRPDPLDIDARYPTRVDNPPTAALLRAR